VVLPGRLRRSEAAASTDCQLFDEAGACGIYLYCGAVWARGRQGKFVRASTRSPSSTARPSGSSSASRPAAVSTPTPGSSRGTWAGTSQEARRWSWRTWPARPRSAPSIPGNASRARSRRQAEGHSLPV